ncbi:Uncharacterised protein [Salmonella enterica subsp. enterica serovar Typhimurium str. DT104]|uniref:Uncharacterized protein n=2 Tax=Salmonella enterica I TaxID=59201 RepID=A0A8D4ZS80_SALET|nr:hypothetical protein SE14_02451 [Salmonella enterica subsp. enterica serovar Typhimurium]ARV69536.1 hypothetical protein B6N26_03274 [Salmonella enterica subsp. enterica]CFB83781.1 Uncharacterised protein [Salmonella enterica subsp. enterica serovar Typhimurium str. DT104]SBL16357.1 Uncharacterised protein [Salmonella enterica subsp. enterica serovar Java]SQH44257.1 Uncharacterised protein [Salmonella enterica subsp. enterica serovar Stanley]SQJ19801.1 Uncharacterised protein [Salmonella en
MHQVNEVRCDKDIPGRTTSDSTDDVQVKYPDDG